MNNLGNTITNTASGNKFFDPTYLNLEYIFQKILDFFNNLGLGSVGLFLKILFFIIILFLIFVIIYCTIGILKVREKEKEHIKHKIEEYARKQKEKEEKLSNSSNNSVNPKWQSVLNHVFSNNESEWKVAIIEADTMLEGLMDQLGFKGENLGEKLKSADQEKLKHLTSAWEVHTIRNKIAHEGSNFEISQREAKRVITLYEQIFTEFSFI